MPTSLLADGYGTREECGRRECPLPLGEGVREEAPLSEPARTTALHYYYDIRRWYVIGRLVLKRYLDIV